MLHGIITAFDGLDKLFSRRSEVVEAVPEAAPRKMRRKRGPSPSKVAETRALAEEGLTVAEAAKRLGITSAAVSVRGKAYGIKFCNARKRPQRKWTPRRETELLRLVDEGLSYQEIGKIMGTSGAAVQQVAYRLGVRRVDRQIWSPEQLRDLIAKWNAGKSASEIADDFGRPFTRNSVLGKLHRLRKQGRIRMSEAA